MTPITSALMRAIEVQMLNAQLDGKGGLIDLDSSPGLRDAFLDAPKGTLYLELAPAESATRALWAELLEAGAQPPMTAITPGEGNGVAVLLCPDGIEMYVMSDNPEEGTLIAQLSPEPGNRLSGASSAARVLSPSSCQKGNGRVRDRPAVFLINGG